MKAFEGIGGEEWAKPQSVEWNDLCFLAEVGVVVNADNRLFTLRYTRSIMNVSRARFTHSMQNGTLAESRSEEGRLTGS